MLAKLTFGAVSCYLPIKVEFILIRKHHTIDIIRSQIVGRSSGDCLIFDDAQKVGTGIERSGKIQRVNETLEVACFWKLLDVVLRHQLGL